MKSVILKHFPPIILNNKTGQTDLRKIKSDHKALKNPQAKMDTKLLYHFCELFGTEILSSTSVFITLVQAHSQYSAPALTAVRNVSLEALKYFDSPLDVIAAPVLFPDLAEKKLLRTCPGHCNRSC